MSAILGGINIASLAAVLYLAYQKGGDVPMSYGLTGLLAVIFAIVGLILGVMALQEKDVFRVFPVLGIILNLAVLGSLMFVVQLGF